MELFGREASRGQLHMWNGLLYRYSLRRPDLYPCIRRVVQADSVMVSYIHVSHQVCGVGVGLV